MQVIYSIIGIVTILIVAISYFCGWIEQKDIATSALALIGTFIGATLAFRLNEKKEYLQLHAKQREALNRALFILVRQFNALSQLEKEFKKYGSNVEKAFIMPAHKPPPYHDLTHNFSDLEFLLEHNETNLVFELTIEQERFHQAISALTIRNDFFVNEVQIASEKASLHGWSVTESEIREIFGNRIFFGAMQAARIAEEIITANVTSNAKAQEKLFAVAKAIYPKHKFIKYEPA